MRVAILTNAYPPDAQGGAARVAELQTQLLRQAGYEVQVFCPRIRWWRYPIALRFLFHALDAYPRFWLAAEIRAWKPDILMTHNLTGCGFSTPRWARGHALWVHVLHDIQLFEPSGQASTIATITWWQRGWSWYRELALGGPDVVVSPTNWLLEEHRRRGFFKNTRYQILPNPLPFLSSSVAHAVRRSQEDRLRLLFVGRVSADKGSRVLEEIFRRVASLGNVQLDVVGEGADVDRLKKISMDVVCHGALASDRVRGLMEEVDVLLVPSQIIENQPNVILEAAAVGLPVVASALGGIPETLGEAGIVCAPQDVEAWVLALQSLRDPVIYEREILGMQQLAVRHEARHCLQLLEEVLKRKR